ncbi:MAG: hypothetical protein IIT46_12050, partial [Lachnospiraceae bacterium]|nr:hypothetical protein [Lachnospiraceae bacterium]
ETTEETTQKGSGEDNTYANNPTTGDDFPLEIMIMLSSAALIFALIYVKIKLDQSEKKDSVK